MSGTPRRSVTPGRSATPTRSVSRRRTAGGDHFQVRSSDEVARVARQWSRHVQSRARELFKKSELDDLLMQVARGIERNKDPILGRADECVQWHGIITKEDWAGIRVPKMGQEGSTITPMNRFLAFIFASDEIFEKLKRLPKAAPFQMSCDNKQCICIAHVSLDAAASRFSRSSSRSRRTASKRLPELRTRVDFLERLPFGMCERVLMLCSYKGVKEARAVSHCWKDAVTCFLIPNEVEQRLLLAWNEVWRVLLLACQRTRHRSLFMRFAAPWVHELCVKLLGLYDAMVPDGILDRQAYENCLLLYDCMELRLSIRISLMVLEEVHTKLRRQALDSDANFPWPEFGGVYGAVMRKSTNMNLYGAEQVPKTGMPSRWRRDLTLPYRFWVFDALNWYAGGSGHVTRDDILRLLGSMEALLVERQRGAWTSALDSAMVWARDIPAKLSTEHAGDTLASLCLAPAYALSQILRHVYDLASDPEVVETIFQDIPVIGTAGSLPHQLSTLLRGDRVVTRKNWADVVQVILQFPPLAYLRTRLPQVLPEKLFESDFAGMAYEKFLSWVGGSIDEATFVRNATPSLQAGLARCGAVFQEQISELANSRVLEMFSMYENPETHVELMMQKLKCAVQERLDSFAPEFASHLFAILNINNDGALTTQELNRGRCVFRAPSLQEALEKTFDVVDTNHDGVLQPEELGSFVRKVLDVFVTIVQLVIESIGAIVASICREHAGAVGEMLKESRKQFEMDDVRNYELAMFLWSFVFRASSEFMISPWALAPIHKMGGAHPPAGKSKIDSAVKKAIYEGGSGSGATNSTVLPLPRQGTGEMQDQNKILRAELASAEAANKAIAAERDKLLAELAALRKQLANTASAVEEPHGLGKGGLETSSLSRPKSKRSPTPRPPTPALEEADEAMEPSTSKHAPRRSNFSVLQETFHSNNATNSFSPKSRPSRRSSRPNVRMSLAEHEFLKPDEDIEVGSAGGKEYEEKQGGATAVDTDDHVVHVDVVGVSGLLVLSLDIHTGSPLSVRNLRQQLVDPSGIPCPEQQLLIGSRMLADKERLEQDDAVDGHVTVTVMRRSNFTLDVVADQEVLKLGFTPATYPPDEVIVKSVDAGSWAERQGIMAGDQLIEVNDHVVSAMTKQDLKRVMIMRPIRLAFDQSNSASCLGGTSSSGLSVSPASTSASPSASSVSPVQGKSRTAARSSTTGAMERLPDRRTARESRRATAATRSSRSPSTFGMASRDSQARNF